MRKESEKKVVLTEIICDKCNTKIMRSHYTVEFTCLVCHKDLCDVCKEGSYKIYKEDRWDEDTYHSMGFICKDCLTPSLKADFEKISGYNNRISKLEEQVNELTSLKFKMYQSIYDKIMEVVKK